ncbi:MAG TPA: metallophosphoesterase, partial [Thermoanaerobaculia bacterium]|nr:metallophosphoesterase [Thermoanaerobaculia bacterium]
MRQLALRQLATRLFAALLLLALSSPRAADAARVVAIGDIHGAYDPLVEILQAAGLVDEELAWSGGDATLVQLGDFTDRGPRVRAVMDLLMRLQQEAPAAGGRVEVLLGNHEALNLVGERRDVSHLTLLEFSSESSGAALEEEYRAVVRAARARARATGSPRPVSDASARETWMRGHPPGTLAYLESLLPDGHYGRWLRSLPTVTVIDGLLFLHAGLRPELATRSPDEINRQVWDEVRQLDACRQALGGAGYLTLTSTTSDLVRIGFAMLDQFAAARDAGKLGADQEDLFATLGSCVDYENWYLFSPEGPLWFRGYADPRPDRGDRGSYGWTDAEGLPAIARILTAQGVRHVIVGHNTGSDGAIRVRFGGRAFLIDTGMLSEVYGGKPSALEIVDGVFTAIYADRREELWT